MMTAAAAAAATMFRGCVRVLAHCATEKALRVQKAKLGKTNANSSNKTTKWKKNKNKNE